MCLAVPIKITAVHSDQTATGELNGVRIDFSVELIDAPRAGDYAIVHAGVAIELLDVKEAEETLRLLAEALPDGLH
jgi:hydrogenase expression/formation protein HypC